MSDLDLAPSESIIIKSSNVARDTMFSDYSHDLILTNQNLIFVEKGVFGKIKKINRYPLNRIKRTEDNVSALRGRSSDGNPRLEVYLIDGHECFKFQSNERYEMNRRIKAINKAVAGNDEMAEDPGSSHQRSAKHVTVSGKCKGCGAPLIGVKGQAVKCPYCDTKQTL